MTSLRDFMGSEKREKAARKGMTKRKAVKKEPDYEADMRLPEGMTCEDCQHVRRCLAFGFTEDPEMMSCDFWPNRFTPKAVQP